MPRSDAILVELFAPAKCHGWRQRGAEDTVGYVKRGKYRAICIQLCEKVEVNVRNSILFDWNNRLIALST